jgi:hypothetical protein
MTTYKEIRGTNIEVLASDPSNPVVGQVWYNSTDNVVKGFYVNPGSWATGGALNLGREDATGIGTQAAAIVAGGTGAALVESYNGTNWTEVNDLNTARGRLSSGGTPTSALVFAGRTPAPSTTGATETWNGTNWTEVNDLNTARENGGGAGASSTNGLFFGGDPVVAITELYNGTNWAEVNNMNNARGTFNGCGTNTAALAVAGKNVPSSGNKTELWNGTNWTELNNLSGASRYGVGVAGITTSALVFGGFGPAENQKLTESWNGSSWTAVTAMSQGRAAPAGAGTSNTAALATGGGSPTASTEEWDAGPATLTFTDS